MLKKLYIKGQKISYIDRQSLRAKRVSLSISPLGIVTASRPWWVSSKLVRQFVKAKSDWIRARLQEINKYKRNPLLHVDKKTYYQYKERARDFISNRVEQLNQKYKFKYNRIAVRNQRTVWGSCSQKCNLNFNYKLLFLPPRLADYVIVHELCHLRELNHSPNFWTLVAQTFPDYKKLKKDLQALTKHNG